MRMVLKENIVEALIGVLVVGVAIWFVTFAYGRTGGGARDGYQVDALFSNASGVGIGTDVRVAGMTVGRVTAVSLDPQSWQAKLTLGIDRKVKLPADSSAAITSEGIMGGSFIAMLPGGDTAMLKDGDQIIETQGSVDLMGMIGQFINQTGGIGKDGPADGGGASGAPAAGGAAPAAPVPANGPASAAPGPQ